jgi:hypothetical protein
VSIGARAIWTTRLYHSAVRNPLIS